ncbi:MAG: EutN/CcmL family microcompartment protein [Bacteroidota bacterium]
MHLCRVTGAIVSTQKADRLHARRLLTIERIDLSGRPTGRPEDVALDPGLDAGEGDIVLVAKEGAVVADLFDRQLEPGALATPANVVIVAIVDEWTADGSIVPTGAR